MDEAAQQGPISHRLTLALACLMVAQAGLGLAFREEYRDAAWITATWFGNDWFTLVVAAPTLLVAGARARQGSTRGWLVWVGLLGYGVYNYAYYLLGAALNVFFPLYVAGSVLSAGALILVLSCANITAIAGDFSATTPGRTVGGYLIAVGLGLAGVWLTLWAAHVFAGRPTPATPEVFKLVAALDLTMMAIPLVAAGVLLWGRHPWGFVLSCLTGIQSALYLTVLSVNSIVAIKLGVVQPPGELPVWAPLAVATATAVVALLAHVRPATSAGISRTPGS
jgi:hypothetical protein